MKRFSRRLTNRRKMPVEYRCESPIRSQHLSNMSMRSPTKKYLTKQRVKRVLSPTSRKIDVSASTQPTLMDSLPDSPPKHNQDENRIKPEANNFSIEKSEDIHEVEGNVADSSDGIESESVADLIKEFNGIGSASVPMLRPAVLEKSAGDTAREELHQYLKDMKAKTDSGGEQLVQFPDNFDEIVSLMSEKDLSDKPKDRASWSNALLGRGIDKKMAFKEHEALDREKLRIAKGVAKTRKLDQRLAEVESKLTKKSLETLQEELGAESTFLTQTLNTSRSTRSMAASESALSARTMPPVPSKIMSIHGKKSRSFESRIARLNFAKNINTKSSASLTSRSTSGNFIDRNKEIAGSKSDLTKDEEDRVKRLLATDVPESDVPNLSVNEVSTSIAPKAYSPMKEEKDRVSDINKRLETMLADRQQDVKLHLEEASINELTIEFSKSGDVIEQQRGQRLFATKLRDINKALNEIKAADAEDFDEGRPGTAFSRATSIRSVQSGDLETLLTQARIEIPQEKRASPEDIKKLLEKLNPASITINS